MSATEVADNTGSDNTAIRPFQVGFPDAELTELRRRINATRWPERETVSDYSQGRRIAALETLHESHGAWRDIHFIHVRSQHEDALPLMGTQAAPGTAPTVLRRDARSVQIAPQLAEQRTSAHSGSPRPARTVRARARRVTQA
jgi:hypothetical protein